MNDTPPPPPSSAAAPPTPSHQPPPYAAPPGAPAEKPPTLAVLSLVLGLVGVVTACVGLGLLLGLAAILLGVIALATTKAAPGGPKPKGRGMAVGGIAAGLLAIVVFAVTIAAFISAGWHAKQAALGLVQHSQARQIHFALHAHAYDQQDENPTQPSRFTTNPFDLVDPGYIDAAIFEDPFGDEPVPDDFDQWAAADRARWLRNQGGFVLLPGVTEGSSGDTIAVISKPASSPQGVVVVTQDGLALHRNDLDALEEEVHNQTGKTLDQLVDEFERGWY